MKLSNKFKIGDKLKCVEIKNPKRKINYNDSLGHGCGWRLGTTVIITSIYGDGHSSYGPIYDTRPNGGIYEDSLDFERDWDE